MSNSIVADGYIIADARRILLVSTVDDSTILDIDTVTQPDTIDIPADDSIKPYATFFAHDDITDDGSIFSYITIFTKNRTFAEDRLYYWHDVLAF